MNLTKPAGVRTVAIALLLTLVAILAACSSVRLISDYDEETDKQLTALKKLSDTHFTAMFAELPMSKPDARSAKNAYDSKKGFYSDFSEKLTQLEFRAQSMPKNSQTVDLLGKLRAATLLSESSLEICETSGLPDDDPKTDLSSLQAIHCLKSNKAQGAKRAVLVPSQRNIDQLIGQALALELKKKMGADSK